MGKNKNNGDKPMTVSAMKQILPLMVTGIAAIVLSIGGLFVYQSNHEKVALEQSQAKALASAIANQVRGLIHEASTQLDLLADRPEVENALANNTLTQFNASPHLWQPDSTLILVPRRGADTSQFSYTAQELLKEVRLGQPFFSLNSLMKPITPPTTFHESSCKLINNNNFTIFNHIIYINFVEIMRLKPLIDVM